MSNIDTKRIVIIGGGISGLALCLALKRLNAKAPRTGVAYSPLVVEPQSSESAAAGLVEDGQHLLLWRWAVEALVDDLHVGGGLSRTAAPIVGLSVSLPDLEALDPLDLQSPPIRQFPPPASRLKEGTDLNTSLPPLVSIRRCDLIRLLMRAIVGDKSVDGREYLPQPANNSGLVDATHVDDREADLAEGKWFERQDFASLLGEDLFVTGDRLKLFYIHPATGKVTVEFKSGRIEIADMLVGADGKNSTVRKLLYLNITKQQRSVIPRSPISPANAPTSSHPRPAEYSGAAVFCGVTRLHIPPTDAPDFLEASRKPIEDLRRMDVQEFVPDGRSVTVFGTAKGGWFGCTNLGNGLIGWRLVVPQEDKSQIANGFTALKNRELMNEAIKSNPGAGANIMSVVGGEGINQGVQKKLGTVVTDTTNPEDKWTSASGSLPRKPGKLRMAETKFNEPEDLLPGEGSSDSPLEDGVKKSRRRKSIDMSLLQTALMAKPQASRNNSVNDMDDRSSTRSAFASSLFGAPNPLSGQEVRMLALRYAEPENFPHPIYAIISRTDPALTTLTDSADLASTPLDTFSIPNPNGSNAPPPPNLHRGRVILIGDAAHPISVNANGSLSPGLAVTDAVYLAKLMSKYLDPRYVDRTELDEEILTPGPKLGGEGFGKFMASAMAASGPAGDGGGEDDDGADDDDPALRHERLMYERLADEFDERVGLAADLMKEARSESGRFDGPLRAKKVLLNNSVVKGLWRMGKGLVQNGSDSVNEETEIYVLMMKRGAVKKGLPPL
ncbi:hypothetical protein HDU83_004651 [Entophlyctis luteolus]|nr:hypothetical protein HDU83_004651 [Entophlyctis luteolus]KAJ3392920.1 hypothetical protein HDU84_003136 [Entophlyctis sp. JEL0112]